MGEFLILLSDLETNFQQGGFYFPTLYIHKSGGFKEPVNLKKGGLMEEKNKKEKTDYLVPLSINGMLHRLPVLCPHIIGSICSHF